MARHNLDKNLNVIMDKNITIFSALFTKQPILKKRLVCSKITICPTSLEGSWNHFLRFASRQSLENCVSNSMLSISM